MKTVTYNRFIENGRLTKAEVRQIKEFNRLKNRENKGYTQFDAREFEKRKMR